MRGIVIYDDYGVAGRYRGFDKDLSNCDHVAIVIEGGRPIVFALDGDALSHIEMERYITESKGKSELVGHFERPEQ